MTAAALVASLALAFVPLRTPVAPMSPAALGIPAAAPVPVVDHLRPQGARAAYWLREAMRLSPTVRRLAARIEQSDVIVYLDISRALDQGVSACLTWMADTATRRIVRATFRAELTTLQAIALLAHELSHAVEVIEHPEVRSDTALLGLYARIGHRTAANGLRWDTAEAIAVGDLARLEAAGPNPPRPPAVRKRTS
jgi:hypothetical protein